MKIKFLEGWLKTLKFTLSSTADRSIPLFINFTKKEISRINLRFSSGGKGSKAIYIYKEVYR